MTITAKLVQVLPLQTGIGKNGEWKKQDIIVETDGQYPKKICISVWGDKINNNQLQIGNVLKLDFDIESREFNGKWYTDLKAWKVEVANSTTPNDSNTSDNDTIDEKPHEIDEDDLPF